MHWKRSQYFSLIIDDSLKNLNHWSSIWKIYFIWVIYLETTILREALWPTYVMRPHKKWTASVASL